MSFNKFLKIFISSVLLFSGLNLTFAQEKLALTITPPLIKINISPGEIFSSSVKIVNNNPSDLTVYAFIRDFKGGTGEGGQIEFIEEKEIEGKERYLLSKWIDISREQILIPPYQSKQVPFTIRVPREAEPGGKYALILVGTNPSTGKIPGGGIKISSLVSSLLLVNVRGAIIEKARIREFSTEKNFYQKPEVKFTLRVENMGNVHIQPQGEIKIYNFWGKERGFIPINHKTEFGNVLPKSIRRWEFVWNGEGSPLEAGRYKAVLTLIYGNETKQTLSQTLYFWVLPIIPVLSILGGVFLFFAFIFLTVRTYVKRAIFLAQKEAGVISTSQVRFQPLILRKPITQAFKDFRKKKKESKNKIEVFSFLIKRWLKPIAAILIIILGITAISLYFKEVLKSSRGYKIIIEEEEKIF